MSHNPYHAPQESSPRRLRQQLRDERASLLASAAMINILAAAVNIRNYALTRPQDPVGLALVGLLSLAALVITLYVMTSPRLRRS